MPILESFVRLAGAELLVKGTLLLSAGWIGAWALRRGSAGLRHLLWLSAIVSAVLLPALGPMRRLHVAILPGVQSASDIAAPSFAPLVRSGTIASTPPIHAPAIVHHMSGAAVVALLWAVIAGVVLLWFLAGELRVRRVVRRARAADRALWRNVLERASAAAQLSSMPRLLVSDAVDTAFTCDALVPTIVLPAESDEWSADRRFAVLLHELAHVRRRDLAAFAVARFACALYWFHPLVWAAARRLRMENELACDQVVLDQGVRASDYAQHLLDMVTALRPRTSAPRAALALVRRSEFEGRLVAILDGSLPRATPSRTRFATLVGSMAVLTLTIAAVQPVRRGARNPLTDSRPLTSAELHDAHVAFAALSRFGTAAVANPLLALLRESDSLGLSAAQADSIATLNRRYTAMVSSIWQPVVRYTQAHPDLNDERLLNGSGFTAARAVTAGVLADIAPRVAQLLRASQRERLPADVAPYFAVGRGRGGPPQVVNRALLDGGARGRISGPGR